MRIVVIGLGQSLRGDDAAGLEAVRQWQESFPETASRPEVRVETSEVPGLELLDLFGDAEAVVLIDAVQSSSTPGTIHRVVPEDLSTFASDSKSAHGWGVAETLKIGRMVNPALGRIYVRLLGIEMEQIETGKGLSESVQKAIPLACKAIQDEVQTLLS